MKEDYKDLIIKILTKHFKDTTNLLDFIADNFPETDELITTWFNERAEKQKYFNKILKEYGK